MVTMEFCKPRGTAPRRQTSISLSVARPTSAMRTMMPLVESIFLDDANTGRGQSCSSMLLGAVLSAATQLRKHCAHRSNANKGEC